MKNIFPLLIILIALCAGCAPTRKAGVHNIASYDYCMISHREVGGYQDDAIMALNRAFIIISDQDNNISNAAVRKRTCILSVDTSRGFWRCSGEATLKDFGDRQLIQRSRKGGGFLYAGAHSDVKSALEDLASARIESGPVHLDTKDRDIGPVNNSTPATNEQRLIELNNLLNRKVITEEEYKLKREQILKDL